MWLLNLLFRIRALLATARLANGIFFLTLAAMTVMTNCNKIRHFGDDHGQGGYHFFLRFVLLVATSKSNAQLTLQLFSAGMSLLFVCVYFFFCSPRGSFAHSVSSSNPGSFIDQNVQYTFDTAAAAVNYGTFVHSASPVTRSAGNFAASLPAGNGRRLSQHNMRHMSPAYYYDGT